MNKKRLSAIVAVGLLIGVYAVERYFDVEEAKDIIEEGIKVKGDTNTFFLPKSTTGQVIHHDSYSLSYHEAYEQPEWVAYELKKSHLSTTNFKRPYFEIDPAVKTKAAHWKNYKKSGYDRGHLCPAGDRKYSQIAHDETFLTSNISPQTHAFNAGVWNSLEQKVRYWASKYDGVYVVTGGVLKGDLPTIGSEKVAVPNYFYKILIDYNKAQPKALAFLMEHKDSKKALRSFVVPIDTVEHLTGIDFFPRLDDHLEERLERSTNLEAWGL
ncbi:MAG: DNA/RNA non-specific endonuclease [Flavobacteriaceae bacterium]|nr:DNA/RNA non-specific endonuclease [Flavobacteriaceae bacterium]